jgi:hypothetical protein
MKTTSKITIGGNSDEPTLVIETTVCEGVIDVITYYADDETKCYNVGTVAYMNSDFLDVEDFIDIAATEAEHYPGETLIAAKQEEKDGV